MSGRPTHARRDHAFERIRASRWTASARTAPRFERRLCRRNRALGGGSEGGQSAPPRVVDSGVAPSLIGASVKRREDQRLLTGRGRFVADLTLPRMVHAAFLRSQHAHARILGIDTTAAIAGAGVVGV